MPTILEHLAALFDKDMRAVLSNPRAISMIANPSARVQMAAVRRDRSVICFIEKPTEKVKVCQNAHLLFLCTKPRLSQAGALLLPKDFVSLSITFYTM